MSVDYDLIVLGGAPVGRYAAMRARQFGARVALIEPSESPDLAEAELALKLLIEINRAIRQQDWLKQWSQSSQPLNAQSCLSRFELSWAKTAHWVKALAETFEISTMSNGVATSLTRLMTLGVDVIRANGGFCQRPNLGFVVGERLLRSRAYLLAPQAQAIRPAIDGLAAIDCATCTNWFNHWSSHESLPDHLLILGLDPRGLVLAQALNRLGTQVTLLTSHDRLLPDPELSSLFQAQLEAEGVTILTRTQVTQVRQPDQIQVQINRDQISGGQLETAAILLATTLRPDLDALNLALAGVNWQQGRSVNLTVNARLQTTQPRIYACITETHDQADQQTADIALHNALFWPPKTARTRDIPEVLPTDPPLSWVGLSPQQAQQRYGAAVQSSQLKLPQWLDTDWFQLIAHRDGRLLGGRGIGADACDAVCLVGLAIQQNLKIKALGQTPAADLIRQAAAQFQRPEWQRELLETWFNLRRSR
jgi:pyruvate/2-oxoglutarate dehydrogenase complex dihydrolipoamide dehydrogenase (E3) component